MRHRQAVAHLVVDGGQNRATNHDPERVQRLILFRLKGETEEELTQSANAVKAFVNSNAGGFPEDKGGGASSAPMTREDIDKIKDPLARIRARAEHIELYK